MEIVAFGVLGRVEKESMSSNVSLDLVFWLTENEEMHCNVMHYDQMRDSCSREKTEGN